MATFETVGGTVYFSSTQGTKIAMMAKTIKHFWRGGEFNTAKAQILNNYKLKKIAVDNLD